MADTYLSEMCSSFGAQTKVERRENQAGLTILCASLFSGKEQEKAFLGGDECHRQLSHKVNDFILMKEKF